MSDISWFSYTVKQKVLFALYLKETSFGCDHQNVRVALIFHGQQFILCWAVGPKLEWCACPSDLPFVGHITKLIELPIIIGHIISCGEKQIQSIMWEAEK